LQWKLEEISENFLSCLFIIKILFFTGGFGCKLTQVGEEATNQMKKIRKGLFLKDFVGEICGQKADIPTKEIGIGKPKNLRNEMAGEGKGEPF